LKVFAAQLGYLHAPRKDRPTRAEENGIQLPELTAGQYLVDAMLMLGPIRSTGMGPRPTDWPEIEAFARLTGRISEPWEAETLHAMCLEYVAEYQCGDQLLRRPPMDARRMKEEQSD
jgi:hypothetical protein